MLKGRKFDVQKESMHEKIYIYLNEVPCLTKGLTAEIEKNVQWLWEGRSKFDFANDNDQTDHTKHYLPKNLPPTEPTYPTS